MIGRRAMLGIGLGFGAGTVAGCSPPPGGVADAVPARPRPDYYPGDYDDLVEASRREPSITIYSNMDTYNWRPVVEGFQKHYPWIDDIVTTNLGSSQVFQRHNAEMAAGNPRASLLVSGAPQNWIDFVEAGDALDHASPEVPHLPDFGHPREGLYTFSADVIFFVYNKVLLDEHERPDSLAGLIELCQSQPDRFRRKITTYTPSVSFGLSIHRAFYLHEQRKGADPWRVYDALLPFVQAEESTGPMVDKIASGEYLAGFFTSSTIVLPQMAQYGKIIDWRCATDGTPLFLRGMGIPKEAPSSVSARLLVDYILSAEGQANIAGGGFTAYREEVAATTNQPTFDSITEEIGAEDVVLVDYDLGTPEEQDEFAAEWVTRLG